MRFIKSVLNKNMSYLFILLLPLAIIFQLSVLPHLPWGIFEVNIILIILFFILRKKPFLGAVLTLILGLFFESYSSRLFFTAFFSFIGPLGVAYLGFYLFPFLQKPRDLVDYLLFTLFYEGVVLLSVAPLYFYGDILRRQLGQDMLWSTIILIVFFLFFLVYETFSQSIFYSRRRSGSAF